MNELQVEKCRRDELKVEVFQRMFQHAAERIIEKEPYLTEIDSVIGDGDHGIGMKRGWTAVQKMLKQTDYAYIDELCRGVSMELLKTMGGASGVIFGTMFFGGISALPHKNVTGTEELCKYFWGGERSIERRGKAKPGDKTMLDALYPACEAMEKVLQQSGDVYALFREAYLAATEGAKESGQIQSRIGRSKNFREKTLGLPDPGAVSTGFLFQAFYETLQGK